MSARDELFTRLKADRGDDAPGDAALAAELDRVFAALPVPSREGLLQRFVERLNEAGGEARVHESVEHFLGWLIGELRDSGAASVVLASHKDFAEMGLSTKISATLPALRVHELPAAFSAEAHSAMIAEAEAAAMGIGRALAGFADSGAIAILSSRNESRSLSLLPETHLAVLREADILPDLGNFSHEMTELLKTDKTSAITLVGGPSKTADIEKVLVTGVHGPRRFLVAVIRKSA
ncbi:MAG: LUD domain-containing protein [Ignavibacteria bacterium]|nr:LUD domain-containing protein [Ignavibacteria bacterium]